MVSNPDLELHSEVIGFLDAYDPQNSDLLSRVDLNGQELVVTTNNFIPLATYEINENGEAFSEGFFYEAMLFVSKRMNFTFKITTPDDGQWGVKRENGSWTGMIGEIADGRAHIGIGEWSIYRRSINIAAEYDMAWEI